MVNKFRFGGALVNPTGPPPDSFDVLDPTEVGDEGFLDRCVGVRVGDTDLLPLPNSNRVDKRFPNPVFPTPDVLSRRMSRKSPVST